MPMSLSANYYAICLCTIWLAAFSSLAHAVRETDWDLKISQQIFFTSWSGFPSRHTNKCIQSKETKHFKLTVWKELEHTEKRLKKSNSHLSNLLLCYLTPFQNLQVRHRLLELLEFRHWKGTGPIFSVANAVSLLPGQNSSHLH